MSSSAKTRSDYVTGFCNSGNHGQCRGAWPHDPAYPKSPTSCACVCHQVTTWTVRYVSEGLDLEEAGWICEEDALHFARYLDDMGLGAQITVERAS